MEIYDLSLKTCLRTDWSKEGIGFFLSQKHCSCDSDLPGCCTDGWRITLCGSRFLKNAEVRYAPVEGEALAVAWALQQTKYFTLGCDDLLIVVDHKPLTKLLGDRTLDEISNPRLFRLKEKTLPWLYKIAWLPGKDNHFSDATSRRPQLNNNDNDLDDLVAMINAHLEHDDDDFSIECYTVASVKRNLNSVVALTWERLQTATFEEMQPLLNTIKQGFPAVKNPSLHPLELLFWPHRNSLHVQDGVIMYKDRVVIPPSLQTNALESIHAAHQGASSMELTAESTVFWPNITKDIESTRHLCVTCNKKRSFAT